MGEQQCPEEAQFPVDIDWEKSEKPQYERSGGQKREPRSHWPATKDHSLDEGLNLQKFSTP